MKKKNMKKPKPKCRENILTPEERINIIDSIKTEEEELVIKGLLFTGLRISELMSTNLLWLLVLLP